MVRTSLGPLPLMLLLVFRKSDLQPGESYPNASRPSSLITLGARAFLIPLSTP